MKIDIRNINKDNIFFSSDTHFFHENIIKYCNRPYKDAHEMTKELIKNWNNTVPTNGTVFLLGDLVIKARTEAIKWTLKQLNGTIYFIYGNHDRNNVITGHISARWKEQGDIMEIAVADDEVSGGYQHIILCHYPMITWNGSHRGSWQLFGHVHGTLDNSDKLSPNQLDVGVDSHNMTPVSYEEVRAIITKNNIIKKL